MTISKFSIKLYPTPATTSLKILHPCMEEGEKRVLDTELTETGRQQAQLLAERLKTEKIDLAATSDLRRARDTALAVVSRHNNISQV